MRGHKGLEQSEQLFCQAKHLNLPGILLLLGLPRLLLRRHWLLRGLLSRLLSRLLRGLLHGLRGLFGSLLSVLGQLGLAECRGLYLRL